MKIRTAISKSLTLIMIAVILGMSTGFTVIVHSCNSCEVETVSAELFNYNKAPDQNCCCETHCHGCTNPETLPETLSLNSIIGPESSCCKNEIEQLRIINFPPAEKFKVLTPGYILLSFSEKESKPPVSSWQVSGQVITPEKYGGPELIYSIHQLLI